MNYFPPFSRAIKFPWTHSDRIPDGDDTAANKLVLYHDGEEYETGQDNMWGTWQGKQFCPTDLVICGLKTRVEEINPDNTALNGVILLCCVKGPVTAACRFIYTKIYSRDLHI